ncbi:hypothetical protein [Brucella cytisi]|uniref:Uncharacterized protein n=1 Tax=Brucella cytisi TaxID=407152 RepID=A0A1J6HHW4_9HYPH|nr:hypothetical protein [Brucella cytisi]OIS92565.1 hypothetical protein BLA27_15380 [Brucella cytisi]
MSFIFFMRSAAYPGDLIGLLGTEDQVQSGQVTAILFRVATSEQVRANGQSWFGEVIPNIQGRLVPFARTGGDGSHVAFWLDDDGRRQIVHLGSERLVCLLGQTPLDFLRLLAIGYEEISGDWFDAPDAPPADGGVNAAYRSWLIERYGVTIPVIAAEILGELPNVLAEASDDPFWRRVRSAQHDWHGGHLTAPSR